MDLFSKITQAFDNRVETGDNHPDTRLTTHYYKSTKKSLYKVCHDMISHNGEMTIVSESEERGEISVKLLGRKDGLMVISIVTLSPFHTAVDMTVSFDKGFQNAFGKKLVCDIYSQLDERFPLS